MNQTAYIVYSTPNYKRLYNNFFFSLVGIGVDAKHIFHKLDNPNIKGRGFQSNLWYYCVRKKVEHFKTILKEQIKNYKYFICSDCDIVFIYKNKHEWDNLYKFVDNSDKQVFYMQEGENEGINAGFCIIKQNYVKEMISFYDIILEKMSVTPRVEMPLGDQTFVNHLQADINYEYIPNIYIVFGWTIFNNKTALIHHAIGSEQINGKLNQIISIKKKFL